MVEVDNFLRTLWEIISEQATTIKTQPQRLHKLWDQYWTKMNVELPPIRLIDLDKEKFLTDIPYRLDRVRTLQAAMGDGFQLIRTIVHSIYNKYIQTQLILEDYSQEDVIPVSFLISDILVGSLLQYIVIDKPPIPIGFILIAKNKSLMKMKALTVERLGKDMYKNGFQVTPEEIQRVLDEMVQMGYLAQEPDNKSGLPAYKFVKEFTISDGESKFKKEIKPILEWVVGLWRSLYNIRSVDTPIPDNYPHKEFLEETVKRAATQGYASAYNVIENIGNYYKIILDNNLTVP
jgi:hypothetical protein